MLFDNRLEGQGSRAGGSPSLQIRQKGYPEMLESKLAVKATVERLKAFIIAASPLVTVKVKNEKGETVETQKRENAKGNILFGFTGRQYESFAEAVDACGGEAEVLNILNAAFADSQREAFKAVVSDENAIPATVDVSSESARSAQIARLTDAGTAAASKVTKPEISSRMEKQAANATVEASIEAHKRGETVDVEALLAAVAKLRK